MSTLARTDGEAYGSRSLSSRVRWRAWARDPERQRYRAVGLLGAVLPEESRRALDLLATGALVAAGRVHSRHRAPAQAGHGPVPKKDDWAQRIFAQACFGLAVLIGR